jgi:hypothetical protein
LATSPVPTALQLPWNQKQKFVPADGLNLKTLALGGFYTQQQTPSKVFAIYVTSSETTLAHDFQLGITDPTLGFIPIGTVSIPPNSGTTSAAPGINLLQKLTHLAQDNSSQPYIFLNPTDVLQGKMAIAAVSGSNSVLITTSGADF